eukprot:998008-Amphidinium_carterae.1
MRGTHTKPTTIAVVCDFTQTVCVTCHRESNPAKDLNYANKLGTNLSKRRAGTVSSSTERSETFRVWSKNRPQKTPKGMVWGKKTRQWKADGTTSLPRGA